MSVKEVFVYLENLGLLNVVIPFVIIFIVAHALLNHVKVFKENKVNAVLAALISFIAIAAADVVSNVSLFSYYLVIAVFVIVSILLILGLWGGKIDLMSGKKKKYASWIILVCMTLLIIYALYRSGLKLNLGSASYSWLNSVVPILIAVLVFILIVWFITSPGKKSEEEAKREAGAEKAPSEKAVKEEEKMPEKEGERKARYVLEKDIRRPSEEKQPLKFFKS